MTSTLEADLLALDQAIATAGLAIWIGAEPTFTRAEALDPPWLFAAEGGDKEERAHAFAKAIATRSGETCYRAEGRTYDGEAHARFAFGIRTGGMPGVGVAVAPPPTTVTPDPGVIEVNLSPSPSLLSFLVQARQVYSAAHEVGLSPTRYRWNGERTDSGGGGQITFGGPTPTDSPFFLYPQLLPSLLRFAQAHPVLSYGFAMECVGSAGQGPRADEGAPERFSELAVALDYLEIRRLRGETTTPEQLFATLAPLLVDGSGNLHRAEINVEKLWNPSLPGRGKWGVVEFRSLQMPPSAEGLTCVAALFRALLAMFAKTPWTHPFVDHGLTLHTSRALPTVLERELSQIITYLEGSDYALGPNIQAQLSSMIHPEVRAEVALDRANLRIARAHEFWPLFGDVASQERNTARLVDASTQRIELRIVCPADEEPGVVTVQGFDLPMYRLPDLPRDVGTSAQPNPGEMSTWLAAVRYRAFAPAPGLHPGLAVHDPITVRWQRGLEVIETSLFGWNPEGGGYSGLPTDEIEAFARRQARTRFRRTQVQTQPAPQITPSLNFLDLRRVSPLA